MASSVLKRNWPIFFLKYNYKTTISSLNSVLIEEEMDLAQIIPLKQLAKVFIFV